MNYQNTRNPVVRSKSHLSGSRNQFINHNGYPTRDSGVQRKLSNVGDYRKSYAMNPDMALQTPRMRSSYCPPSYIDLNDNDDFNENLYAQPNSRMSYCERISQSSSVQSQKRNSLAYPSDKRESLDLAIRVDPTYDKLLQTKEQVGFINPHAPLLTMDRNFTYIRSNENAFTRNTPGRSSDRNFNYHDQPFNRNTPVRSSDRQHYGPQRTSDVFIINSKHHGAMSKPPSTRFKGSVDSRGPDRIAHSSGDSSRNAKKNESTSGQKPERKTSILEGVSDLGLPKNFNSKVMDFSKIILGSHDESVEREVEEIVPKKDEKEEDWFPVQKSMFQNVITSKLEELSNLAKKTSHSSKKRNLNHILKNKIYGLNDCSTLIRKTKRDIKDRIPMSDSLMMFILMEPIIKLDDMYYTLMEGCSNLSYYVGTNSTGTYSLSVYDDPDETVNRIIKSLGILIMLKHSKFVADFVCYFYYTRPIFIICTHSCFEGFLSGIDDMGDNTFSYIVYQMVIILNLLRVARIIHGNIRISSIGLRAETLTFVLCNFDFACFDGELCFKMDYPKELSAPEIKYNSTITYGLDIYHLGMMLMRIIAGKDAKLNKKLTLKEDNLGIMNASFRELIKKLLLEEPSSRLGYENPLEILNHKSLKKPIMDKNLKNKLTQALSCNTQNDPDKEKKTIRYSKSIGVTI